MPDFTLEDLADVVATRAGSGDPNSYTAKLVSGGAPQCAKKFGEEATELAIAAALADGEGVRAEAADVLYHLMVLLHVSGVSFEEVKAELGRRTSRTGLQEKASRSAGA